MAVDRNEVVAYLKDRMRSAMTSRGTTAADVSESFNFMDADLLDSLGFVQLIHDLEQRFGVQLDLSDADPDGLVTIGGLAAAISASPAQ